MNKILLCVLLCAIVLYFFYKEKPKLTDQASEQNTSKTLSQKDQNDTKAQIVDVKDNISDENATLTLDDEVDLDSILPNLNALLSKLRSKEEERVFTGFDPYISEEELSIETFPQVTYFALENLPQEPELTKEDFHFKRQNKKLAIRLLEANMNGQFLWQNEPVWELWRKKGGSNIHTLISGAFYLYQNDDEATYLSDELSISLQRNRKNTYFVSIITPKKYINKPIYDFKSINEYFIFKVGERKFIVAYLFNRDFTKWWECELTSRGLKSTIISSNNGFDIFSNDTNAYEMRLSENETH